MAFIKRMAASERFWIAGFLFVVAIFVGTDIFTDYRSGSPQAHLLAEGILMVGALVGATLLIRQNLSLRTRVSSLNLELETTKADAQKWKAENSQILQGLGVAIDRQFELWKLTTSEKEIALLLLKGLSLKEIADIRQTSDRTVRQQSLAIYSKSGLAGRAELSAFFLEDLMLPTPETNQGKDPTGPNREIIR